MPEEFFFSKVRESAMRVGGHDREFKKNMIFFFLFFLEVNRFSKSAQLLLEQCIYLLISLSGIQE